LIRLLVSDVDGTLVRHDRTLAPSTIAAAERLRAAGVALALVSSRPLAGLDVLLEPLCIDTPRAGFNGGLLCDAEGHVMDELTIPPEACRMAVATLEAAGIDVWVFAGGEWLLRNVQAPYIAREQLSISMGWRVVDDFAPYLHAVHKVMGSSPDIERIARVETSLHAAIGKASAVHRSQNYYIDITHPDANKGRAALAIAQLLGVTPAEMACIGDMPNDLPMLAVAGLGIAMGNAPTIVKAGAHLVVADNDSDGWAEAVTQILAMDMHN
jgi:Cof subfamily protein (haloacid dehalogenase superfamily)